MKLEDAIGNLVLFKFQKGIKNELNIFDIPGENMWGVLSGVEPNIGVWVKHPKYKLKIWFDKDGSTITEENRVEETFETNILIPWQYIKGIMYVRDERFNRENKSSIGFHIERK